MSDENSGLASSAASGSRSPSPFAPPSNAAEELACDAEMSAGGPVGSSAIVTTETSANSRYTNLDATKAHPSRRIL